MNDGFSSRHESSSLVSVDGNGERAKIFTQSTDPNFPSLRILYEDPHLIALQKPAGMLSVPGREACIMFETKPRSNQWQDAIVALADKLRVENGPNSVLFGAVNALLKSVHAVPRKQEKFCRYLARSYKIHERKTQMVIWQLLCELDGQMHHTEATSIPLHLVSAADVADAHVRYRRSQQQATASAVAVDAVPVGVAHALAGEENETVNTTDQTIALDDTDTTPLSQKKHIIYHVHRLDMETSGILIFAKDEPSAAELSRQFRDKVARKVYIARIAGRPAASEEEFEVSAPLRPDHTRRPRQLIDWEHGKEAVTRCRVLRTAAAAAQPEAAASALSSVPSVVSAASAAEAAPAEGVQATDADRVRMFPIEDMPSRLRQLQVQTTLIQLQPITGR